MLGHILGRLLGKE